MKEKLWLGIKVFVKWLLVTIRVLGTHVGATFIFYTWKTGKPLFGLDEWGWGVILLAALGLTAIARLRHSQYIFDDIDDEFEDNKKGS